MHSFMFKKKSVLIYFHYQQFRISLAVIYLLPSLTAATRLLACDFIQI